MIARPPEELVPDTAGWHPRLQRLYGYWRRIAPPGRLPGRQHLDPAELVEFLPDLWLLDVQAEPFRLRYRLMGTAIVEAAGRELTGLWLDEAHPNLAAQPAPLERYRQVVQTGRPSHRRGAPMLFLAHRDASTIENLLLPLASTGEAVDVLLACTVFHRSGGRKS